MTRVLVTGATGLIGSNVCQRLLERGDEAIALVRPGSDRAPLDSIGVRVVEGDVTSSDDVARATLGCEAIVHSAASLGGPDQDPAVHEATNVIGARNVLDAAALTGIRTVTLSTALYLDFSRTLTESSPVSADIPPDAYSASKRRAHREAQERADRGADIVEVIPGAAFGPGLSVQRSLGRESWNRAIRAAINGRISDHLVGSPAPWVFADDTALAIVAALDKGRAGSTYLAFGAEDASDLPDFLNLACEVAGVSHRLIGLRVDDDNRTELLARFGPSLIANAERRWPKPWFDNTATSEALDYHPRPLRSALESTVDWLRGLGHI